MDRENDAFQHAPGTTQQYPEMIAPYARLLGHPVFRAVDDLPRLRAFMQGHVFAVWDFLSLLKRMQRDMTCVTLPWVPPANPVAARMVNELVLAEESDMGPDGQPRSHLELYLAAMDEVGADARPFRRFCAALRDGVALEHALAQADVPAHVRAFVTTTLTQACHGRIEEVISSFYFGRENIIPGMFRRLLERLQSVHAPTFVYYLDRHIDLDGDAHGPAAERILHMYVAGDAAARERAVRAALAAIDARIQLFDGILHSLPGLH